jgi:long-chain acyl-CoA synthetase
MGADIDLSAGETLVHLFERSIAAHGGRAMAVMGDEVLTYAELGKYSAALAAHFRRAGLHKGDRVALMMGNNLAFPITLAAAQCSGLIAVPVNPLYTARELAHQLSDAGVRCIVLSESLHAQHKLVIEQAGVLQSLLLPDFGLLEAIAQEAREMGVASICSAEPVVPLARAIAQNTDESFPSVTIEPEHPALLQYTGGTTGLSKDTLIYEPHRAR